MAFMAWSQGSRQIHYCLNGHLAEPARLAAIPIAYYVKGCADVPLGHRLQPPRDLAWVFQRNLGRPCVHCPNHGVLGNGPAGRPAIWKGTDIAPYPANLCPPWRYVVNEVRRLADDYDDYLVARLTSECKPDAGGLSTLRKHVVGAPSYDNFEQKKNDSLLDVHLAITLEILAGILAHIGSVLPIDMTELATSRLTPASSALSSPRRPRGLRCSPRCRRTPRGLCPVGIA